MRNLIREFQAFAIKGNMLDLAIGVIIGAAFGRIVTALVDDLIMPPITLLIGTGRYSDAALTLREAAPGIEPVLWRYGHFIQTCIDFLIVAACVFVMVRAINRLQRQPPPADIPPPAPTRQEELLAEIRDLLRTRS